MPHLKFLSCAVLAKPAGPGMVTDTAFLLLSICAPELEEVFCGRLFAAFDVDLLHCLARYWQSNCPPLHTIISELDLWIDEVEEENIKTFDKTCLTGRMRHTRWPDNFQYEYLDACEDLYFLNFPYTIRPRDYVLSFSEYIDSYIEEDYSDVQWIRKKL
ncbi:hypothetical protein P389DRAFT_173135 [Cystobasidium minutum MCA 4210]|uniref:uncharacterized protein n=1 Tax=Cystobasidium minutum MCA 4210 TaxID=1397322 RepID=UPI0034CD82AF|eukprot:jgi/Rhomi1/173135/fgenesh1_kg.5_\